MNHSKIVNLVLAAALVVLLLKMNFFTPTVSEDVKVQSNEPIDFSKGNQKSIGADYSFFPTPAVVVGTKVNGKANWLTASNVGHMGRKHLFVGSQKVHHSNIGIKENMTLSVSMVSESMMAKADYVGMKSGKDTDKSKVFDHFYGELKNAPLIKEAPVTMECKVVKIMDVGLYDYFVLEVVNTYVNESILAENGKINYQDFHPLLFEMSTMKYIPTANPVGSGFQEAKKYKIN